MRAPTPQCQPTVIAASIAAALLLAGCGSTGSPSASTNPFAVSTGNGTLQPHISTLRAFGDSYTDIAFTNSKGTSNWVTELTARVPTDVKLNYAIGGARAGKGGHREFDRQIDTMTGLGQDKISDSDLTIAYFGYNDINKNGARDDLVRAKLGMAEGVDRLIAMGATKDNRRLFVTQIHDWSKNPGIADSTHGQVVAWNSYLAELANSKENVIAVDLYTAFERIFADPAAFGFRNVSTPDARRSAADALFNDTTHFGTRGQRVIARVYEHYLTRGWGWANTLSAGSESAAKLNSEIDQGILAFGLNQPANLGRFQLIPLGLETGLFSGQKTHRSFGGRTFSSEAAPKGFAINFASNSSLFRDAGNYGLALTQNSAPVTLATGERAIQRYDSSASSFYWHQPASGFLLTTQISNHQVEVDSNERDDLINRSVTNSSEGSTWSFEQKIRKPLGNDWALFTPWMSVSGLSHQLKGQTLQSVYTSDVRFNSTSASDVLSGIGFDFQFAPLAVGNGSKLTFGGSLSHSESLYRSKVKLAMTEANQPGFTQRESLTRERLRNTMLGLQASLTLNAQVNLTASYATDLQKLKDSQTVRLQANISF